MADNVVVSENVGTGATVATDDIGGVQYQRVKMVLGADGTNDGDVSSTNPMPVELDSTATIFDSFNRLRVSMPHTLFDSQQEYGLDFLRLWDGVLCDASGGPSYTYSYTAQMTPFGYIADAAGNQIGATYAGTTGTAGQNLRKTATDKMTPITVSADNGDYAILQSRQYPRYIPGKGLLAFITGVFATGSNPTVKLVVRTNTTGTPSDSNSVTKGSWNIDNFDGTGPSGLTLDFTKTQILVIAAQWLGVGSVVVGFEVGKKLWPAHQFDHANVLDVPYSQTFNLPIRLEAQCVTTSTVARVGVFDKQNGVFLECTKATAGGTIKLVCCSLQSEGGEESKGFPHAVGNGITTIGVTTRRPVLSIRPAALYNFLTNRGHIELADLDISASSQSAYYELVMGGTLTGASWLRKGSSVTAGSFVAGLTYVILTVGTTDFTLIGAASNTVGLEFVATGAGTGTGTACLDVSMVEYDVSASTIVGGVVIAAGTAPAGGAARSAVSSDIDIRGPLTLSQIDALTPMQGNLTVVCTSFTATSNVSATLHWHEQVV